MDCFRLEIGGIWIYFGLGVEEISFSFPFLLLFSRRMIIKDANVMLQYLKLKF